MGVVIDLEQKRRSFLAKKSFRGWSRRFPEPLGELTCPKDLCGPTLAALIRADEETTALLTDMVMRAKDLGAGARFDFLETSNKMIVTDIAIFILDQLRFECMRRLGWIEDYPTLDVPFIDMVSDFDSRYFTLRNETPSLSPVHPGYPDYEATFESDRGGFLRRLIPEAIRCFEERVQGGGEDRVD